MLNNLIMYGKNGKFDVVFNIYAMLTGEKPYDESAFCLYINEITAVACEYRMCGNCYRNYIAWLIANDENSFSLEGELQAVKCDALEQLARMDISLIRKLFFVNTDNAPKDVKQMFDLLCDFKLPDEKKITNLSIIGKLSSDLAQQLSDTKNDDEFFGIIEEFYLLMGVGQFGLNKAFRIKEHIDGDFSLIPVSVFDEVLFCDLWGYDYQKKQLIENTELFLDGKPANDVLLYGDSGTGKSTCIKALLNEYHHNGLRIIEVYKHQFKYLAPLINILKNRNYSFIIYMDDLSFEDFEIEYKYLKAVIEGGMETRPQNVLIYATSNRRHLIKETWKDRADYDEDMHHSDTVQEKLSLSDRFGVSINFSKPVQKEYFEIIKHLAKKYKISMSEEELVNTARAWGVQHGGYSGRVAKQLITKLRSEN